MDTATPSLADIAAVTKNNDCDGNGGWLWIIVLFLIMMGGGVWGNRNGGAADNAMIARAATTEDVNASAWRQQQDGMLRQITYGVADSAYSLNNAIGGIGTQVLESKYDNALRIDDAKATIQNCCSETNRAIDGINYNASMNTAAINENTTAQAQKILDAISQNKIDALQGQVNQLQLQAALCGVVRYPNSTTYTAGASPFFAAAPFAYGTSF